MLTVASGRVSLAAPPAEAPAAAPGDQSRGPEMPDPEKIALETSDGVGLTVWYYAVRKDEKPQGIILLVHDLDGSHATIEPFAKGLQQLDYAVVAPDLRGHGASTNLTAGGATTLDANALRKNDLLAIAASAGGRVREQAATRGDLEAVRGWIKRQSDAGAVDIERLCVVGCGAGGTLAALWTVADYAWPPTTSGPQGRQVRGLALISPAWTVKGVSIQPALKADAVRREVPLLILSGKNDRDGMRLVDQFKGLRPKEWFIQQPGKKPETADGLAAPTDATFFSVQLDTTLSADKLAADRSTNAARVVATFLAIALESQR
jgi:dienelactone hydrolase